MPRGNNTTKTPQAGSEATNVGDAVEQQVVAFAEQLGRIVGTVQARAEGWLDPSALSEQVTRVRDSAAALLQQLGAKTEHKTQRIISGKGGRISITTIDRGTKIGGRSGGVVDAPGKKHRKPTPDVTVRANAADAGRVAKMKSMNATRRRGRG